MMNKKPHPRKHKFFEIVADLFLPPRCPVCKALLPPGFTICDDCSDKLNICRTQTHYGDMSMMLPAAYFRSVEFDSFFAPFFYAGAVKDLLINFKFGSHPEIAGFIARQMLPAAEQLLKEGTVDAVTFVPISRSRKRIRGYDQSEMIAKRIAKDLGIQFYDKAIEKVFDVPPQHDQKYFSRFGNVFGAYDADESLCKDRHFLLIDDIATTGATLNECAKMLKIANAESVHCLTAAVVESKENRNFYHNDDNKTVINAAGRFTQQK